MVGASAGALAATLAACDADMDLAMTIALDLCDANQVLLSIVSFPYRAAAFLLHTLLIKAGFNRTPKIIYASKTQQ